MLSSFARGCRKRLFSCAVTNLRTRYWREYRQQTRGGKGIRTMKITPKTGGVVGVVQVSDADELMLVTDRGRLIRLRVDEIRVAGRNTQGVKLLEVDQGERLVSLALVEESEPESGSPDTDGSASDADEAGTSED